MYGGPGNGCGGGSVGGWGGAKHIETRLSRCDWGHWLFPGCFLPNEQVPIFTVMCRSQGNGMGQRSSLTCELLEQNMQRLNSPIIMLMESSFLAGLALHTRTLPLLSSELWTITLKYGKVEGRGAYPRIWTRK